MSLIESVLEFLDTWKWMRSYTLYSAVLPGQKGYEEAPYEQCIERIPGVWKTEVRR